MILVSSGVYRNLTLNISREKTRIVGMGDEKVRGSSNEKFLLSVTREKIVSIAREGRM